LLFLLCPLCSRLCIFMSVWRAISVLRPNKICLSPLIAIPFPSRSCSTSPLEKRHIMASTDVTSQGRAETQAPAELPKLSPSDFRAYNRLAEHMDLFVSFPLITSTSVASLISSLPAQSFSSDLEHYILCMHNKPAACRHVHPAIPFYRP
jgi:hypothetical protein